MEIERASFVSSSGSLHPKATRRRNDPGRFAALLALHRAAGNTAVCGLIENAKPQLGLLRDISSERFEVSLPSQDRAQRTAAKGSPGRDARQKTLQRRGGQDRSGATSCVVQRNDSKLEKKAKKLADELQKLIDGATWKEIRKRVYPKESAAGVARAKKRKTSKLPDLTGLGSIKSLERFASAVRGIQLKWTTLKPDDRVRELAAAVNGELTAASVPGFLIVGKQAMEFKGFFTPGQWQFTISETLVDAPSLGNADAAELCNTASHEARHAEQAFLSARYAAGVRKDDAAAIVTKQGIPKVIADKAVAKKFDAKTDAATADLGKRMFQATVTDAAKNQAISDDDGLAELAVKSSKAQTALTALKATASAATITSATAARDSLRAQIVVVEQKYTLYRNIAYEADAHEVGDAAEQAFKGWP